MNIQDAIRYANGDPKDVALLQEIEQTYIRLMEVCPFRIEYRIQIGRASCRERVCQYV